MHLSFCPQGEFPFPRQAFDVACERSATVGTLEGRLRDVEDYAAGVRYGQALRLAGVTGKRPRGRRNPSDKFRLGTGYGRTATPAEYRAKLAACRVQATEYRKAIAAELARPW